MIFLSDYEKPPHRSVILVRKRQILSDWCKRDWPHWYWCQCNILVNSFRRNSKSFNNTEWQLLKAKLDWKSYCWFLESCHMDTFAGLWLNNKSSVNFLLRPIAVGGWSFPFAYRNIWACRIRSFEPVCLTWESCSVYEDECKTNLGQCYYINGMSLTIVQCGEKDIPVEQTDSEYSAH